MPFIGFRQNDYITLLKALQGKCWTIVLYNGIKAYEKAGFVREGTLRQAMYHNDEYCDFFVMSILRKEYYERKKKKYHPCKKS